MRLRLAGAVAFCAGLAVMGIELCAVRLLAPHFGDSAYVWTNVIGVILLALALGALLGGKLLDGGGSRRALGALLFAAALVVTLAPLLARPLGDWLVPQDLRLEEAMPALVRGSLVASVVLFGVPVVLLGAVSPWLVGLAAKAGTPIGAAAGTISAAATLGSVLGTFLTTHWSVPTFGSRATLLGCATLLAAAAALCMARGKTTPLLLIPLFGLLAAGGPRKATPAGEQVVEELESAYQFLQVVRTSDQGVAQTALKINEGLDSFHSLSRADGPMTNGAYYDYHAATPLLCADAEVARGRRSPRVLSLGAACGTFDRIFAQAWPGSVVDEVEIDPAVLALTDRRFGGKKANGARVALDARVFCNRTRTAYDVVLVDTYARQIYVPAHVTSGELFTRVREILREGGVVAVNLGGRSFDDRVIGCVAATMASVFGKCAAFRVPASRNFMLCARRGAPLAVPFDPAGAAGAGLATAAQRELLAPVLTALRKPGAWREFAEGAGPVLKDGWPLLDALQDEALRERQVEGGLLGMQGAVPPAAAEKQAYEALQQTGFEKALELLRSASGETAYLRFLAGDVRWSLHDPAGAVLEYERARLLAADVVGADVLAQRRQGAAELAERGQRAAAVGQRNGWWAGGVCGALLLALGVVLARV